MSTTRNLFIGIAVLAVVAASGTVAVLRLVRGPSAAAQPGPAAAVPVTVAQVVVKPMPVRVGAIGNVEAYTSVAVKARVDGQIVAVGFKEGDEVKKGAMLFEIDPRPYAAELNQAQANLQRDRALLERAVDQEKRYKDLLQKSFISTEAYEQVRTNLDTAKATVAADVAAAENARLSLDYCTIRSPITGYTGRILIQRGNLVKANDVNPLVTLNQVVPISVSFSVPEQDLNEIRRYQADGELQVEVRPPGASDESIAGKLSFIDNAVDATTGTIRLKAEFANTDKRLWPGQFVNVVLTLHEQNDALVAPAAALQNGPNGQYVFVVKPDKTVEIRDVKVARTEGDDAVVASGLSAGDTVVTVGQLRLAPGMRVAAGKSS